MSYLEFRDRDTAVCLTGTEVHHIAWLAQQALAAWLRRPAYQGIRRDLGVPDPSSPFFESQILMTMGEPRQVRGRKVYLIDLGRNMLYWDTPEAGILCWLYGHALHHGWAAGADRAALAGEFQAAVDAGLARRHMGDQHAGPLTTGGVTLPPGDHGGWEEVIAFLRSGNEDVVTSLSIGGCFPDRDIAREAGVWQPPDPSPWDEDAEAAWEELPPGQQWDLCMQALHDSPGRQWQPGMRYCFGDWILDGGDLAPAHLRTPS